MKLLPSRFDALLDRGLDGEQRRFLYGLGFDQQARPLVNGHVAGVDACFRLSRR
jgi:hypothetical protein